jgi:XTP/dITP diphosphohydrolase
LTRILIATHNPGKLQEFRELVGNVADVVSLSELGLRSPIEDGETFEANAEIKARNAARRSGLVTVADDSGLEVDALMGAPGVYSARYAGEHASDFKNRSLLLERLVHADPVDRQARFVCAITVCSLNDRCETFRGSWEGHIATHARGSNGFGYDPIFELPDGRTAAELPWSEKNLISHRAIALQQALPHLRNLVTAE